MRGPSQLLEPIDDANLGHALDLLARGFKRGSHQFWEQAVERITRYNQYGSRRGIGHLLAVKGKRAGVLLTLNSETQAAEDRRYRVTNLSSWYVDPEHRRLAPLMLREAIRDRETVFTDLTPSAEVVRMLPLLGFGPLNTGISAIALPVAAVQRTADARVLDLESIDDGVLAPETRTLMERNAEFGAIAAVLSAGGRHYPLLFIYRTLRRLPAAQLIYCDDNAAMMKEIGAIARFLLKRRRLILVIDIPPDRQAPGTHFPGRGLKFAKGGCFVNRTDYGGSELLLVGQ
jgi:hypothetical protein